MEGIGKLSRMTPPIDSDEALCIVTAFCEEGDLFKRIRDKDVHKETFSEDEIMDMFIQVTHPHPHPPAAGMAPCMPWCCSIRVHHVASNVLGAWHFAAAKNSLHSCCSST